MHIYIISFFLTILFIWLAKTKVKSKKTKITLLIIAVLPMLLVSALRYNVGTDYGKRYVANYDMIREGIEVEDLEIGFKIIDYNYAYKLVFEYIEAFYNTVRIHSHCDYASPNDYEKKYWIKLRQMEINVA